MSNRNACWFARSIASWPTRITLIAEPATASDPLGIWLAILAAFGFSFKAILVKLAYAQPVAVPLDAITLLTLRMLFAAPFFAWVAVREVLHAEALRGRDWMAIVVLGLLGYYGAVMLDFVGLRYISAGLERLIAFTYPLLTILLGSLLLSRRIERQEWLAMLLCYAGIAAAFAHDLSIAADAAAIWIGSAFVLASSLAYALYLLGSEEMIGRIGTARFTALAMLVSTAAALVHFFLTQPAPALFAQPWQIDALSLAMALFSTVLPVFALSAALRRVGAGRAALVGMVGPLLTIVFGWWLLDDPISIAQLIGAALVIAGVLAVSRRRRTASK